MNARHAALLTLFLIMAAASTGERPTAPLPAAPAAAAPPASADTPTVYPYPLAPREPGPAVTIIDDLVNHYGPVVFDHALHEQMSGISGECANCHHETPDHELITGCRECHPTARSSAHLGVPSLKGAFHRQCLSCHKDWSHANSCNSCHAEAGVAMHGPEDFGELLSAPPTHITPEPTYTYHTERPGLATVTFHHEDHARVFGLACADCHFNDACERCHGAGTARQVVQREQDCAGCHADNDCVTCHDSATKSRFDHQTAAGWRLGDAHAQEACDTCHGPSHGPGHGAAVAAPTRERCLACHQGVHALGLGDSPTDVALLGSHAMFDCVQCHKGSGVDAGPSCTDCHDGRTYPESVPGLPASR